MPEPQPIATAPTDGTVILTDVGIAYHGEPESWDKRLRKASWFACDVWGDAYLSGSESEISVFPTLWTPLPDWMKK